MGGNTSKSKNKNIFDDKVIVSFTVPVTICPTPIPKHIKNKLKTRGLKKWFNWALSEVGSNYKTEISHYTNFNTKDIKIKNGKINVIGSMTLTKNKNKIKYMPSNMLTKDKYMKYIKIQIPHASRIGEPIQVIEKKYNVWFKKVENIKIKSNTNLRSSPSTSATKYPVGKKKKGLDGKMWIISKTKTGVKRWKKLNKK